jgi:hypothetical protein
MARPAVEEVGVTLTTSSDPGKLHAMTLTAKVHNHTITLPADVEIPDGVEVQVTLPDPAPVKPPPTSFFDSIRDLIGTAEGLPADFAAEHDHYVHGTRKRTER